VPIGPADLRNVSFTLSPDSGQGYSEDDVNAFLRLAGAEIIRLDLDNRALREELRRRAGPRDTAPDHPGTELLALRSRLADLEDSRDRAVRHLMTLRSALAEAGGQRAAGAAGTGGRGDEARVLALARQAADDCLRDAAQEADAVLSKARVRALQLSSEAELQASTIGSNARHHHSAVLGNVARERAEALREIDRLSRAARDHARTLHETLTGRITDLAGTGARTTPMPHP
jgi:DivIVA domain-containing protein